MEDFGVSQVAATLGLTLFVAGYGTHEVTPMFALRTNPIQVLDL